MIFLLAIPAVWVILMINEANNKPRYRRCGCQRCAWEADRPYHG